MSFQLPYPIEGTVRIEKENVTGWSMEEPHEYLTEHESGDVAERIRNDVKANHGIGYEADFKAYESGRYEIVEVREIEEES